MYNNLKKQRLLTNNIAKNIDELLEISDNAPFLSKNAKMMKIIIEIIQDIQATSGATVTIEEDEKTGEGIVSVSGVILSKRLSIAVIRFLSAK